MENSTFDPIAFQHGPSYAGNARIDRVSARQVQNVWIGRTLSRGTGDHRLLGQLAN